jgi:hypothetical protein
MDEAEMIRMLIKHGDPDVLRTGLLGMGWPNAVANEQAQSMRLGLDHSGIESAMQRLSDQYSRQSPGPYETLLGVEYGRKPSPRQMYREQMDGRKKSTVSPFFLK